MIVKTNDKTTAMPARPAPHIIPILIDQYKKVKSNGSLIAVRNRIIDNAPTIPKESTMFDCMVRIIAVAALEEWIIIVIIIPAIMPRKMLKAPLFVKFVRKDTLSALSAGMILESMSSPRNKSPNPINASPIDSFLIFLYETSKKPTPNMGTAKAEILNLKPNRDTIHAVMVVPIFAPKITPTDCLSVSNPAFTNDTTITVVAEDD